MSALVHIFSPLRRAATAFFTHDVALRRDGGGSVRIVLAQRGTSGPGGASTGGGLAQVLAQREQRELALIQAQLAELLSGLPDTRRAMRQLASVEQALGRQGLKALHTLPLDVLRKALEQIESMVTNWSPAGLASLRSKMAVAIIDREHMAADTQADAGPTAAVPENSPDATALHDPAASLPGAFGGSSEDAALAAAYAALGGAAPATGVEMQPELGAGAVCRVLVTPTPVEDKSGDLQISAG